MGVLGNPQKALSEAPLLAAKAARFFESLADQWWDPLGKFSALHAITPLRFEIIEAVVQKHFQRGKDWTGLRILDIGSGGGLLSEPLARTGAAVTGLEPVEKSVRVAEAHAAQQGLSVTYVCGDTASPSLATKTFEVVICAEVIEHVTDPAAFIKAAGALVRPGGLLIASTLNRTAASFLLAKVMAEYVLGWLAVGTHRFGCFVKPAELESFCRAAGLEVFDACGIGYHPWGARWHKTRGLSVNYFLMARKPSKAL